MNRKTAAFLAVMLTAGLALAPALAAAKAGAGGSMGSRGSRTYQMAPATPTAPAARPVERSATPPAPSQTQPAQQPRPAAAPAPTAAQPQPGFFQRPFMAGLMGGLIGAGIGGLLFGHGLFGAGGFGGLGFGGLFGLLLQLALVYFAVRFALGLFRRQAPQPAGGPAGYDHDTSPAQPRVADMPPADYTIAGSAPMIGEADFTAFQQALGDIQAAWSKGDLDALRRHATPEMVGYFARELALLASRGLTNHVEAVNLEQGDLAEAWSEDGIDYATVAMRWSALDYTTREDGSLAAGSRDARSESTEIWTFLRSRDGGKWLLSAIQQPDSP